MTNAPTPSWFDPTPRACEIAFDRFDHVMIEQAERIQGLRESLADCYVGTAKTAALVGIELTRLCAFLGRNPRPNGEAA
jgi:hypothetical protein